MERKSFGLIASIALAMVVAACSQPAPAAPPAKESAPAVKEAAPAQPAAKDAPAQPAAKAPAAAPDGAAKAQEMLAAAKKEGSLSVTTHTNLLYRELISSFKEKNPDIQVEHNSIRPSEFAPKVVTEQQNGQFAYDIWISPTSNMVEVVLPAGGFQPLAPYLLPETLDAKNWRTGKPLYATNDPLILLNRGNVDGTVWVNRDIVPSSEFNNTEQIVDPKFKGKIMLRTPDAPHATSLNMTGWLNAKGEDFVWKVMKDQEPVYIDNARLLTQNIINGKYPLAVGIDGATLDNCITSGGCKNLEEVRAGNMKYLLGHGIGMLKSAPHPNASAVFMNWFFSKDGQDAFVKGIKATEPTGKDAHSIHPDVDPHPDSVQNGMVPDYSNINQYSLQGMEQGAPQMQKVIELYRKVEAGG
jgi:ABC-type Fe3+ transport system substrate-binding protein